MQTSNGVVPFTVAFSNGKVEAYEGTFEIDDHGLLIIAPLIVDQNYTTKLIYAPGSWLGVDVRDGDRQED